MRDCSCIEVLKYKLRGLSSGKHCSDVFKVPVVEIKGLLFLKSHYYCRNGWVSFIFQMKIYGFF